MFKKCKHVQLQEQTESANHSPGESLQTQSAYMLKDSSND